MLFTLSAPSGAGKSTIAREMLRMFPTLAFSISATTRQRRVKEMHGREYYFLSRDTFEEQIRRSELVEWEEIFGNYYGTLKSEIDTAILEGRHLLFDVDVKGGLSIKRLYGDRVVSIFIEPPSIDVLRERLERRGSDSAEVIATRLARAEWELAQAPQFDHVVLNDDLATSVPAVAAIIGAHIRPVTP